MKTRADAAAELDAIDLDALDRALEIARVQGTDRPEQIDVMMQDRDWLDVARFASGCAQGRSLNLKPWESAPIWGAEVGDAPEDNLLRRMLAAGLSQFEPDPIGALGRGGKRK